MLNTKDEILFKFASLLADFPIEAPEPPNPEDIKTMPPSKAPEQKVDVVKPIEFSVEPEHGSGEWMAKHHPREFLLETKNPYRGWIRDPAYRELTKNIMDSLVDKNPENYFAWNLNRREELKPWLYPAAKSIIQKDSLAALILEIYKFTELQDLNTELWKAVLDKEITRSAFDYKSRGIPFAHKIFNKMRHLAGRIASTDPEFYNLYIEGKPVTTKQFDEEARRVLKQKEDLGKYKPIKLRYKTKL